MVFLAVMLVAPPDVDAEGEPGLLSITASGSEVWAATLTVDAPAREVRLDWAPLQGDLT